MRWFEGDVTKPETCSAAFQGVHCVIHCAAHVDYAFPADRKTIDHVNVEGQKECYPPIHLHHIIYISQLFLFHGKKIN